MSIVEDLVARARQFAESMNGQPEGSVEVALPQLASILAESTDPAVVAETVTALGHAMDPRAAQLILERVRLDDVDVATRLAAAQALPNGVDRDAPCWERVTAALITLSADPGSEVRDWACFGLGQIEADSPDARDALAARLADPHDDTRCEALVALAKTGDPRARDELVRRLAGDPDYVWTLELEAAAELADPVLHPLLVRLADGWEGDDDDHTPALAVAITRCHPDAPAAAERVERALEARLDSLMRDSELTVTLTGRYPRTRLLVRHGDETVPSDGFSLIWSDYEPTTYPVEQEAQSICFTLLGPTAFDSP